MIDIFEKSTLQEGANIALENKLCLENGALICNYYEIMDNLNIYKKATIYIYYQSEIKIHPIASALTFSYKGDPTVTNLQIFVKEDYRRNGIGREIITFAKKYEKVKSFYVVRWNKDASLFFNSVNADGKQKGLDAEYIAN